jgi:hypothetical protein
MAEFSKTFQCYQTFKDFSNNEMHYELYQSEEILTSQILRTGRFGKHWYGGNIADLVQAKFIQLTL